MVYRIDNRPKKNRGRNIALIAIIPIILIVGYIGFVDGGKFVKLSQDTLNGTPEDAHTETMQTTTPQNMSLSAVALQIHNMVNNERESKGLPPLSWDNGIANVALAHSKDMAVNNYVNHNDLNGNTPAQRLSRAGVCDGYSGENMANDYSLDPSIESGRVFNGWMGDTPHELNLLSSGYTREGIGIYASSTQIYTTEDFC